MLTDGLDFLPGWYRIEKEAGKAIQKLSSIEELGVFLKNPDPFIRRQAILRMSKIRLKDTYSQLHEVLNDAAETEENRKLAALIMCNLNKSLDLGYFISHPLLAEFTGEEDLEGLLSVSVIDPKPNLSLNFRASSIESQLNPGSEVIPSEIYGKEESFSFPLKEWLHHFYKNLLINLVTCLKKCLRGAASALFIMAPKKAAALFSSLINALSRKREDRSDLSEAVPSRKRRQKRVSVTYKTSRRHPTPLGISVKRMLRRFFYTLFSPLRLLFRFKITVLVTLIVLYSLFSFTQPGKSFLFRINPQAYQMNAEFLERSERWALQLISSNPTLAVVFKTKPLPPVSETLEVEEPKTYRVTASKGLYLRVAPGSLGEKLYLMKADTTVQFLGEEQRDPSGSLWYKIKLKEMIGWANAQYLKEVK